MDFLLATTSSPAPMDIGHVKGDTPYKGGKLGKYDQKGKGYKGKGKEPRIGEKGKWAEKENFEG